MFQLGQRTGQEPKTALPEATKASTWATTPGSQSTKTNTQKSHTARSTTLPPYGTIQNERTDDSSTPNDLMRKAVPPSGQKQGTDLANGRETSVVSVPKEGSNTIEQVRMDAGITGRNKRVGGSVNLTSAEPLPLTSTSTVPAAHQQQTVHKPKLLLKSKQFPNGNDVLLHPSSAFPPRSSTVDSSQLSSGSETSRRSTGPESWDEHFRPSEQLATEMLTAADANVYVGHGRYRHLGKAAYRGSEGLYFESSVRSVSSVSTSSSTNEAWAAMDEKKHLLYGLRDKVKGIYEGGRSASPSPCPAPFVTPFGEKSSDVDDRLLPPDDTTAARTPGQETGISAFQMRFLAQLYTAFKRADVSNDECPTTEDIRRTFFEDDIVWKVFHLKKQPPEENDGMTKSSCASQAVLAPPACLKRPEQSQATSLRVHTSNTSSVFGQQGTRPVTCRERVRHFWTQLWSEYFPPETPQPVSTEPPVTSTPGSIFQSAWRKAVGLTRHVTKPCCDPRSSWSFTPRSRKKVAAMLRRLNVLETEAATKFRSTGSTCVWFPQYARAFSPFVGDSNWATAAEDDSTKGRRQFPNICHRLVAPSVVHRFIRDGYIGMNVSQYEISMPGNLTLPGTLCMEGPSCALAAKNRGGVPRIPPDYSLAERSQQTEQITDRTKKAVTTKAEDMDRLLQRLLADTKWFSMENQKLSQRLNQYHESRFQQRKEPQAPPTALLQRPVVDTSHLDLLMKQVQETDAARARLVCSKPVSYLEDYPDFDWQAGEYLTSPEPRSARVSIVQPETLSERSPWDLSAGASSRRSVIQRNFDEEVDLGWDLLP